MEKYFKDVRFSASVFGLGLSSATLLLSIDLCSQEHALQTKPTFEGEKVV